MLNAGFKILGSAVALAALLVLGACGSDEKEALPPVTSLFNGSQDNPVITSPTVSISRDTDSNPSDSSARDEGRRRCIIDSRTLRTAQEAFYAKNGRYATGDEDLVTQGFLSEPSTLHDFELVPPPPGGLMAFNLIVTDPMCGVPGHHTGETPADV